MNDSYKLLFHDEKGESGNTYIILPSTESPRIILPLSNRNNFRTGLNVHNTASPLNRLKSFVLRESFPFIKILRRNILYGTSKLEQLKNDIQETLKQKRPVEFSGFYGTESKSRKLTFQVITSEGNVIAYLKIADNVQARMYIDNERWANDFLHTLPDLPIHVPETINIFDWNDWRLLLETSVSKHTKKVGYTLTNDITDSLISIAEKTKVEAALNRYLITLEENVSKFFNDYRVHPEVLASIHKSIDNLRNKSFPLVFSHGDFVPYNIRRGKHTLSVFDLEYAKRQGLPFCDAFHFIYQGSYQIFKKDAKYIIEHKIKNHTTNRTQLLRYAAALCINADLLSDFFRLYLTESLMFDVDNRPHQLIKDNHFLQGLEYLVAHTF